MEQTLTAGWAWDPVHPASHVYAKMALNLIEKVATPPAKSDSRKRKRSEDSGSGAGAGSHSGSGLANPRFGHCSGQSRDGSGNQRGGMQQTASYGSGSGYGYAGTGQVGNRNYTPSQYSNQSRGRAGSVSSRGTSGMGFYGGQSYQGYRGGGGGGGERGGGRGAGNRGLPRGQYWPRW